jgi:glycosyltransferase involved in cell wall biosynthesis
MISLLILNFTDLKHDSRVSRQVQFLSEKHQVSVACYGVGNFTKVDFYQLKRPRLAIRNKLFLSFFLLLRFHSYAIKLLYGHRYLRNSLADKNFDLIICNDIESLPLAFDLGLGEKILLDAHEYSPRQFEDKLMWRVFFQPLNKFICKKFIPRVDAMTTIGNGIAREYKKNFPCNPIVINNATWFFDLKPTDNIDKIRLIHHGGATTSRQLELMIEMMEYLDDRFTLDLMLIIPEMASAKTRNYITYLKELAKDDSRIHFKPAVKSNEVVNFINQYDVGIILVPPINFNYANGLPNKLFEFIQARLAIAIGPIPEIAEVINEYNIGIVSEDFTPKKLAQELSKLTNERLHLFKSNTALAASQLSAEKNQEVFLELVEKTINRI